MNPKASLEFSSRLACGRCFGIRTDSSRSVTRNNVCNHSCRCDGQMADNVIDNKALVIVAVKTEV